MPYAIVTGASKGIGKAFAENLAGRKFNLVLVARSEELLNQLSTKLQQENGVTVYSLVLDLSKRESPKRIFEFITEKKLDVEVLINNVGYSLWGNFHELGLEEQNEMITANIFTTVNLSHLLIPLLLKNKKSYILNVCSTAAYQSVPTMTIYSASKAFILSFTRGLRWELRNTSISVSCLSPGSANTDFIERAKMEHMRKAAEKVNWEPADVAEAGLSGMFKGKAEIIPGFINQLNALAPRLAPKTLVENIAGNLYKKKEK